MILKKAFIAALLIVATPTLVMAANTVVFEGRISNPTCSVSVNDGTASSVTVPVQRGRTPASVTVMLL